jgi:hypothetical protein
MDIDCRPLTVVNAPGTTAEHVRFLHSRLLLCLAIDFVFLVQRGDDVDLATLTAKHSASTSEK